MRSLDKQIQVARERTGNIDYSYSLTTGAISAGLSQDFFKEAANEAQDHLQAAILAVKADLFLEDEITQIVANTESYTLAGRVFGGTKLKSMQYAYDEDVNSYKPLPQRTLAERNTAECTEPSFYIPKGNAFLLNPIPNVSQGTVRTSYFRELDDLDIRRGTVSGTPSGAVITLAASPYTYDLNLAEHICISDKYGNVMLYAGAVSSCVTTTLTLLANVSTYLVSGYTLANLANGYVTIGRYSTTHSKLPDMCERYILTYVQKRAYHKETHEGSLFEDSELMRMQDSILSLYAEKTEDITEVPILDSGILY